MDVAMVSLVHLSGFCAGTSPCGVVLGDVSSRASDHLVEVTCPRCLDAAARIGRQYRGALRNGAVKGRFNGRVLEERVDDGRWRRFDHVSWLQSDLGEYTATLRVRRLG